MTHDTGETSHALLSSACRLLKDSWRCWKGRIVTEAQFTSTPEALVAFMDKLEHEVAAIDLEGGFLSHWLHKGLKGRQEARVRESIAGNAMLEAVAEPIPRARVALRRELAKLQKLVRNLSREDPVSTSAKPFGSCAV